MLSFQNFAQDCKPADTKKLHKNLSSKKEIFSEVEGWDSDELEMDHMSEIPELKDRNHLHLKALASDTITESIATPVNVASFIQVF